MFKISDRHWAAFSDSSRESFELRAEAYLSRHFPKKMEPLSPKERREVIRHYVEEAKLYSLTSEQAVICFTHICFLIGDNFESREQWSWVPRMLSDIEYDQNFRAKLALQCVADLKMAGVE